MLGDDRGQSIQIGAILLFGILIIGLALFQTVVVPAENEGVEFNGYVETTEDLVTFRNDLVTAGTQGSEQAEAIQTGVRYPSRAVLINPGPPVGSLRTTAAQNVSITGAEAVDSEEANVRGYWSGTEHNYSTRGVRFSPAYNTIDVPPIETSGSGVYRLTGNGPVALTSGAFISGNRLTLVTVDGDISTASMTTSVAATPASVATRSVTLRERSGEELTVTVPVPGNGTDAAAVAWNDSRAAQSLRTSPSVEGTTVNGSRVDVTLDGSRTYQLRLARVVVHDAGDSGVDVDTDPQYLVPLSENGTVVPATGTREISVEVRDTYNNPVSGVDVEFTASGGSIDGPSTVTTGSDGSATVSFGITDSADTAEITAKIDGQGVSPYNSTTIRLVRQGTGDGGDGGINPAGGNDLALESAGIVEFGSGGDKYDGVRATFKNFDQNNEKNITKVRISFYSAGEQGSTGTTPPESATFDPTTAGGSTVTMNVGGDFKNSSYVFSKSQQRTFDLAFYEDQDATGNRFEPEVGDFFIFNVRIDNDGDGTGDTSVTYFIAPR